MLSYYWSTPADLDYYQQISQEPLLITFDIFLPQTMCFVITLRLEEKLPYPQTH